MREYYNICNLIRFSLDGPKEFACSFRYNKYRTDYILDGELDFIVYFDDFKPDINGCLILDDKFYIKKGYFYCAKDKYKFLDWKIEYHNLEGNPIRINVYVNSHLDYFHFSYILIEGFFIDSMIHFVLLKKGHCLVHASCVSDDENKGLLFIARGGAGKTTISTQLIGKGFKFISDNFTILTSENNVIGFVEPLNIFGYNLNKNIKSSISRIDKFKLMIAQAIYILSGGYVKIFIRINPSIIFPTIVQKAKLHSSFILIPTSNLNDRIYFDKIEKNKLLERIEVNQRLEFPYFDKYLLSYSYVFTDTESSKQWENYRKHLDENLSGNFFAIEVPLKYDSSIISEIIARIKECQKY